MGGQPISPSLFQFHRHRCWKTSARRGLDGVGNGNSGSFNTSLNRCPFRERPTPTRFFSARPSGTASDRGAADVPATGSLHPGCGTRALPRGPSHRLVGPRWRIRSIRPAPFDPRPPTGPRRRRGYCVLHKPRGHPAPPRGGRAPWVSSTALVRSNSGIDPTRPAVVPTSPRSFLARVVGTRARGILRQNLRLSRNSALAGRVAPEKRA